MFALVVRRPPRVQLAGDGDADDASTSGAPPAPPRGRGRPPKQQRQPPPMQRARSPTRPGPSSAKKRGKR
eukprot:7386885-Prymnesium_polylepis.1